MNGRDEFRPDVLLEDDFPAFSDSFWVCPFLVFSSDNFLRFVDDALSAEDVWDEDVTWDVPLRDKRKSDVLCLPCGKARGTDALLQEYWEESEARALHIPRVRLGPGWASVT